MSKKVEADVIYKFIKDCTKFTRDEIAGMYAIANNNNVLLAEENKRLKKELEEKDEHIANASKTIKQLKMAVANDPDLVKLCDEWLNNKSFLQQLN